MPWFAKANTLQLYFQWKHKLTCTNTEVCMQSTIGRMPMGNENKMDLNDPLKACHDMMVLFCKISYRLSGGTCP